MIKHVMKGISDSTKETVFKLSVEDTEKGYEEIIVKNIATAKIKFERLCSEYPLEVFELSIFNYEKKILKMSGGALNDGCK